MPKPRNCSPSDVSELRARLRWRCRRGMRELDVLLQAYLDERYDRAGPGEQAAFEALVALEDPELVTRLLGGGPGGGALADVVAGALDAHCHR